MHNETKSNDYFVISKVRQDLWIPNLINQQRSNTMAQHQNLNAHHPNQLSLSQLAVLEAQNNQMAELKKIPSKY